MIRMLDAVLDHITMYRLVLYYLLVLLAASFVLSIFGLVPSDPVALACSTGLILSICLVTNWLFARVFEVPANTESVYITALILILVLDPVAVTDARGMGVLAFASVWAVAGKFLFAIGRKHLFNPAALAVVLTGFLLQTPASWWVAGNVTVLPIVLAGGLLLVRKLRRIDLVATFIAVTLGTTLLTSSPDRYLNVLIESAKSSPLFFFAFVMLTEPLTAPTMRGPRLAFAALVGVLFSPNVHFGDIYLTPEQALVIGNLFAWTVSPKGRLTLTLKRIERSAADTYDFIFGSPQRLAFQAGQYLEWTLGMAHPDSRGNRRYFTIASAPTENELRLGVKFYPEGSAFKLALAGLAPGDTISAAQLAGDFTLPADKTRKLAFIAGGIGITPFRSMLQYLLDRKEARPIVLIYGNERQEDIAYRDLLERAARQLGIPTFHAVAQDPHPDQHPGYIDANLVRTAIPDYMDRTFYLSGPQAMVTSLRALLVGMDVPRSHIKVDFFPGFA